MPASVLTQRFHTAMFLRCLLVLIWRPHHAGWKTGIMVGYHFNLGFAMTEKGDDPNISAIRKIVNNPTMYVILVNFFIVIVESRNPNWFLVL